MVHDNFIYSHSSRYCRSMSVSREIAGKQGRRGLKVVFTSNWRNIGGGAQCTAQCMDPAPTTTPSPGIVFEFYNQSTRQYSVNFYFEMITTYIKERKHLLMFCKSNIFTQAGPGTATASISTAVISWYDILYSPVFVLSNINIKGFFFFSTHLLCCTYITIHHNMFMFSTNNKYL